MYEVLVDGGEFNGEARVETFDNFRVAFHVANLFAELSFNKIRIGKSD
jgi:hypothetical protein